MSEPSGYGLMGYGPWLGRKHHEEMMKKKSQRAWVTKTPVIFSNPVGSGVRMHVLTKEGPMTLEPGDTLELTGETKLDFTILPITTQANVVEWHEEIEESLPEPAVIVDG